MSCKRVLHIDTINLYQCEGEYSADSKPSPADRLLLHLREAADDLHSLAWKGPRSYGNVYTAVLFKRFSDALIDLNRLVASGETELALEALDTLSEAVSDANSQRLADILQVYQEMLLGNEEVAREVADRMGFGLSKNQWWVGLVIFSRDDLGEFRHRCEYLEALTYFDMECSEEYQEYIHECGEHVAQQAASMK